MTICREGHEGHFASRLAWNRFSVALKSLPSTVVGCDSLRNDGDECNAMQPKTLR